MQILRNDGSESELTERFAACPPVGFAALLLYLRKALGQLTLANVISRNDFKPPFVATGVVRPSQRNKGGDRKAGGGHSRRWARQGRCGLSKLYKNENFEIQWTPLERQICLKKF
jgi:hypothetical protein